MLHICICIPKERKLYLIPQFFSSNCCKKNSLLLLYSLQYLKYEYTFRQQYLGRPQRGFCSSPDCGKNRCLIKWGEGGSPLLLQNFSIFISLRTALMFCFLLVLLLLLPQLVFPVKNNAELWGKVKESRERSRIYSSLILT